MNRDQVAAVVLKHISGAREGLQMKDIDTTQSLKDYGVNSLDMVEIVSRSMREMKVKVPRAELRTLTNINGLIDLLHQTMQGVKPAVPAALVPDETTPLHR